MSADPALTSPPRRYRWLQFSLRTMLLGMVAAALVFAWFRQRMEREERIEKAVALLAKAPSQYSLVYDPIALVRAVNALQGLGKEDAIAALRRFAARYPSFGDPHSPHMSLTLVMPLLFERIDPEDEYPSLWITARADWQGFLSIYDDIPFRRGHVSLMGQEGDKIDLIDWADTHGRLRATPLRPGDDPFQAAEKAIESWTAQHEIDRSPTKIISPVEEAQKKEFAAKTMRVEGLGCVAPLLGIAPDKLPYLGSRNDAEWSRLKAECRRLGVRWSEDKQEYVATKQKE
jgi:hypothetical protein